MIVISVTVARVILLCDSGGMAEKRIQGKVTGRASGRVWRKGYDFGRFDRWGFPMVRRLRCGSFLCIGLTARVAPIVVTAMVASNYSSEWLTSMVSSRSGLH